jgi:hypothetical protein
MRELAALQALFGAGLDASAPSRDTLQLFHGEPEQAGRRFGIYRGNAAANGAKAMAATFPVVKKIVGAEFFAGLTREYQSRHPSQHGDLNEYGQAFAGFLAVFPPASEIPYLADVARLEWLVHRAHYAADPGPFDPARLASISPEQQLRLRPCLHPACGILHSAYPLSRIWQVHQDSFDGEFTVDFSQAPSYALVYRRHFRVDVAQVGDAAAAFLAASLAGATLEIALSAAQAHDASFDLGRSLGEWVGSSVIVDFTLNGG